MEIKDINVYNRGVIAAYNGDYENPYKKGTEYYYNWCSGYLCAMGKILKEKYYDN